MSNSVVKAMNRRERRQSKRNTTNQQEEPTHNKISNFQLRQIEPKTTNQNKAFESFFSGQNLALLGYPGTGKSFIAVWLALNEVFNDDQYDKVIILRSAVPSKDVGFLPGNLKEKTKILEEPIKDIVNDLFGRGDAYDNMKNKGKIEFMSTSYIRGLTFDNAIVIVDECQNCEWNELFAVITRLGKNSKIIFCGDYIQSDIKNHYNQTRKEDILKFIDVLKQMKAFDIIEFNPQDIVRSGIVRQFIEACVKTGVFG